MRKQGGRPHLLPAELRAEIARLYFDEKWTAAEIERTVAPGVLLGTIRSIARIEKRKASGSDQPKASNPHEADAQQQIDATASATPGATADSPEVEK